MGEVEASGSRILLWLSRFCLEFMVENNYDILKLNVDFEIIKLILIFRFLGFWGFGEIGRAHV